MDEETPKQPDETADVEDKFSARMRDLAIASLEAGELEEAVWAVAKIKDAQQKALTLQKIDYAIAKKRRTANIKVGIAVLFRLAGLLALAGGKETFLLGTFLALFAIPLFIWGCMDYAEEKGYSKWVGLIGLLGITGLIVLVVTPNKLRDTPWSRMGWHRWTGLIGMALGVLLVIFGVWAANRRFGPLALIANVEYGIWKFDSSTGNMIPLNWFEKLFAVNFGPACVIIGIILGLLSLGLLGFGFHKAKGAATKEAHQN